MITYEPFNSDSHKLTVMLLCGELAQSVSDIFHSLGLNDEQRRWAFEGITLAMIAKLDPPNKIKSREDFRNSAYAIGVELDDFFEGVRSRLKQSVEEAG